METEVEKICTNYSSLDEIVRRKCCPKANPDERSFYVLELDDIYAKHLKWIELLPRVKPFYAIKCNNLPEIVAFLASLGTGFDCASKQEIDQVLSYGVETSKVIYANPCKSTSFISYAKSRQVDLMTFDNQLELHKVAKVFPTARLVLRIKGIDRTSRCKFNSKFGADLTTSHSLLKLAQKLQLNVVGVSFHNGSDCEEIDAYYQSIAAAKSLFKFGAKLGFDMNILDIGGGFPGHNQAKVSFEEVAENVNKALDVFFPIGCGVQVIAEPGRYYVASSMVLVAQVIAKRVELAAPPLKTNGVQHNKLKNGEKKLANGSGGADATSRYMYYLNDGVYGAFNNVIFEHATAQPKLLRQQPIEGVLLEGLDCSERQLRPTIFWGPTCDSIDCIKRDFMFPELQIGEWIVFENMGAYTCCVATLFNGFERATVIIADKSNRAVEC